jgi:hypothetical protein
MKCTPEKQTEFRRYMESKLGETDFEIIWYEENGEEWPHITKFARDQEELHEMDKAYRAILNRP